MDLLCNIFNGVRDTSCLNVVKITSILSAIKNGRWEKQIYELRACGNQKEAKRLKSILPAVTFCGVFEDAREDRNLVHYNQIMIVDIDKVSLHKLNTLKKALKDNRHILGYFVSPNFGLKVLIPVDSTPKQHSTDAFHCIKLMFKQMYDIDIDRSGKNVSRLCFISHDPNVYYNEDAEIFPVEEQVSLEGFRSVSNGMSRENYIPTKNADTILATCAKMVKASKAGSYRKGNRNNFIFVLSCLMCEFGVTQEQTLDIVFQKYNSLGFPEVKNTVLSAFRKNKHNFATKTVNERRNNDQVKLGL